MEYWKDWKISQVDPPIAFKFSAEEIQGSLSLPNGEGWEASLVGFDTVSGLDGAAGLL